MKIGTLVRHIKFGYIGVVIQQGVSTCDKWLVHYDNGVIQDRWCMERELEVLCE